MKKMVAMLLAVLLVFGAGCAPVDTGELSGGEKEPERENVVSENPAVLEIGGEFGEVDLAEYAGKEPMAAEELDAEQQPLFFLAGNHELAGIEIGVSPTDEEVRRFLIWFMESAEYREELEKWKAVDGGYRIPLSELERILYTHLNISGFETNALFADRLDDPALPQWYDSQHRCYVMSEVLGGGGAAALEVLTYNVLPKQEGAVHHLVLGVYDPARYYGDEGREYRLTGLYEAAYWIPEEQVEQYKLLFAHHTPLAIRSDGEVNEQPEVLSHCDERAKEYYEQYVAMWCGENPFRESFDEGETPQRYSVAQLFRNCCLLEFGELPTLSEDNTYAGGLVEDVVTAYFPVTAEQLRERAEAVPDERYEDGQYALPGLQSMTAEGEEYGIVTDYVEDGEQLVLYCSFFYEHSQEPLLRTILTIRRQEQGRFVYVSNEIERIAGDYAYPPQV